MTDRSHSPRILRAAQLADMLGVHRTTLWRWEQTGTFPHRRRFGPQTVGWLAGEVEQWIQSAPVVAATDTRTSADLWDGTPPMSGTAPTDGFDE